MDGSNRNLIGIIVIIVGVMLLFDQIGITQGFSIGYIFSTFWPLFIIWIGVSALMNRRTNVGLFFLLIGILFQVSTLYGWSIWSVFWPLVIIYIGVSALIGRPLLFKRPPSSTTTQDNRLKETVIFWGSERRVMTDSFKGGEVTTIFGGTQLDLREAKLAENGAVLDVTCAFGGVEILVNPANYRVESDGTPVMGGWDSNFMPSDNTSLPVLRIAGTVIFGGVEIKGY
ncbi:hypothetical protein KC614_02365 [candidate division WWE3 bacterium]|uniref:LiaF transmembrane domain-containing protein n=1 Tax=candidate division WWE3 bacterium TaxID=2053526 RepID=A0A955LKI9_UNCKA|nr:hypothetical protein [candidate division WWE3 bacterium]